MQEYICDLSLKLIIIRLDENIQVEYPYLSNMTFFQYHYCEIQVFGKSCIAFLNANLLKMVYFQKLLCYYIKPLKLQSELPFDLHKTNPNIM